MFDAPTLADATIHGNGDVREVSHGSDAGLYVEFRMESVYQEFQSEKEGRPIYEQVPYITIYFPGDKTKKVDRPVRTEPFGMVPPDTVRFRAQWEAFQKGAASVATGLPLTEWPLMTTGQVRELNAINIWTVEQLANIPDTALDRLGHGGRNLRDKAIAHLERLKEGAATARLEQANADLQRHIEEQNRRLEEMEAKLTEKRGPGRPKKETENGE